MRGRLEDRVWEHRPELYAPAAYRKACHYQAFMPDGLVGERFSLPAELSGVVSDAEGEIRAWNASATPAPALLARGLLRTESIASSKVEGLAVDASSLARAEAKADLGASVAATATEVLANIDALSRHAGCIGVRRGDHAGAPLRKPFEANGGSPRRVRSAVGRQRRIFPPSAYDGMWESEPPSMQMACPVMNDPSSDTRKQTRLATSSGSPVRARS
jgi:hypothetical protein